MLFGLFFSAYLAAKYGRDLISELFLAYYVTISLSYHHLENA